MQPQENTGSTSDGFVRQNFASYKSDRKRATRHLRHTLALAEQNGISRDIMVTALLDTATGMMIARGGHAYAMAALESAFHRVVAVGAE